MNDLGTCSLAPYGGQPETEETSHPDARPFLVCTQNQPEVRSNPGSQTPKVQVGATGLRPQGPSRAVKIQVASLPPAGRASARPSDRPSRGTVAPFRGEFRFRHDAEWQRPLAPPPAGGPGLGELACARPSPAGGLGELRHVQPGLISRLRLLQVACLLLTLPSHVSCFCCATSTERRRLKVRARLSNPHAVCSVCSLSVGL